MSTLRKSFIFSVVILFSIFPFKEVLAESNQGYQSTGEISFYGTYEYPSDKPDSKPIPVTPVPNGTLPTTIGTTTPHLNRLPQTGESSSQQSLLVGFIFLVGSIFIYKKTIWGK
ncbi:LPXTG cell wall anchor domain-containing protein [Carnobacterium divergens]|uniref:Gram-positive cocci surface proteins LPxTG domain-containing protein n=1 Tax=Carnobacterium divergens DSM 20623 TaxID=1449336 RepID=A0A0R2HWA6_CARDV|nr:LPXTG cell wall anchor domain-containing protein [Carnobacterium divergens]KRN56994.1 hypothetical protein IV74_GL000644 [Carnobacterium divergens DSM 20623]MDO0874782.1 LPXTG cell wall anchor domain-containing protein [Carnobacterium divergens]SUX16016.1 LPXTG cell wall anchor domain [Carnobacterium divergens]